MSLRPQLLLKPTHTHNKRLSHIKSCRNLLLALPSSDCIQLIAKAQDQGKERKKWQAATLPILWLLQCLSRLYALRLEKPGPGHGKNLLKMSINLVTNSAIKSAGSFIPRTLQIARRSARLIVTEAACQTTTTTITIYDHSIKKYQLSGEGLME